MNKIKTIFPFFLLIYSVFSLNLSLAMDLDEEDEEMLSILMSLCDPDSKGKEEEPISINLVLRESSQEDPSDEILLNIPKETRSSPLKRLKRKNEAHSVLKPHDLFALPSDASSQDSHSISTSQSYESSGEDSFLAPGEHYGSDEEYPFETEDSYSYTHEDASMSSSSEEYEPPLKRLKKEETEIKIPSRDSKRGASSSKKERPQPSFEKKIKQEIEEDPWDESVPLVKNPIRALSKMIDMGMKLKLLSNVYLGNVMGKANIFLPRYRADIELPDETLTTKEGFFKTEKGEICVFASGGLHYIWEKNIRHVYEIFFGKKIKIIRAHWIQKQKHYETTLEEDFSGKKQKDLHSEYYYDLFFRKDFIPQLMQKVKKSSGTLRNLTIDAFSWWDVCNKCEKKLSAHKELLGNDVSLTYKIAAYKPYKKAYPPISCVNHTRIPYNTEQKAWEALWGCISKYTEKSFKNEKKKRRFWTKTHEGLEVCKWLGQAFSERAIALDGRETLEKEGAILSLYKKEQPKKLKALKNLLSYLYDKNWDLSCWYKGPQYPDKVQPKWKRHWKQVCLPHFGWEEVHAIEKKKEEKDKRKGRKKRGDWQPIEFEDREDWKGDCEMCGYEGIENVYRVFHPKLHGSKTFLSFSEKEQKEREGSLGYTHETPLAALSAPLQKKRLQSLCVGSECVKTLTLEKKAIKEWRKSKNGKEIDSKTRQQAKRLRQNDRVDEFEKGLRQTKKRKKK